MVHMSVDNDIQIEGMCDKCKLSLENKRCTACAGKIIDSRTDNPHFDESIFEKLKEKAE